MTLYPEDEPAKEGIIRCWKCGRQLGLFRGDPECIHFMHLVCPTCKSDKFVSRNGGFSEK